jgi:type II secretory pathway component PulM
MEGEACRTLENIDSLMWRQPDSAFALLQAFAASPEADSIDRFEEHYFQLLASELLYKNYCEQSNRAKLLKAVAYYDSIAGSPGAEVRGVSVGPFRRRDASHASAQTTAFLAARAHYINGVGFYERDSVVEACKQFMKAWEQMEEYLETKEADWRITQLKALILTRMTDMYSNMYLHEQAIYFAHLSLTYYQKWEEPSWYVSSMLCEVGTQYNMLNVLDSAKYYYQQACLFLPDTNCLLYRDLMTHSAFLSYETEHHPKESLDILYQALENVDSDKERFSRCLTMGEIYYHENQYDSAWKYLEIVYDNTESEASKKQAAEWLVELCKIQGKESDILGYASFLIPFANQEENQSELKSQLTELYKDFGQKRQERKNQHAKKQYAKRAVAVIGSLFALIAVVAFLYFWHKRKGEHLKAQIKEENYSHKQQQKALSGRLKQKNQEVRELKGQVNQKDKTAKTAQTAASFAEEAICRLIMERVNEGHFKSKMDCEVYKKYALDKQNLLDLRLAADRHFGQFTVRLKKTYPELTNTDLDYCCLYLLGLSNADIAALMQRAYNTVTERDGKLRKIIGNGNSLSKTLSEVANGSLSVDL